MEIDRRTILAGGAALLAAAPGWPKSAAAGAVVSDRTAVAHLPNPLGVAG